MNDDIYLKYIRAFPSSNFFFSRKGDMLFFIREVDGQKLLHALDLKKSVSLDDGICLLKEDLKLRSLNAFDYDEKTRTLYIMADERHQENYNLYSLNLDERILKTLTQEPLVSHFHLSPDFQTVFYGVRTQREDRSFLSKVYRLDLKSGMKEFLFDDDGWEYRMSWHETIPSQDGRKLYFVVDRGNRRANLNIACFDLDTKTHHFLLNKEVENSALNIWSFDIAPDHLHFTSQHEGHQNFYRLHFKDGHIEKIHHFDGRLASSARIGSRNADLKALIAEPRPEQGLTLVHLLDLNSKDIKTTSFKGTLRTFAHSSRLWVNQTAMDQVSCLRELDAGTLQPLREINLHRGNAADLVQCRGYEFLKYPSFDGLEIPGYLALPKASKLRGAVITSFYGGNDIYWPEAHLWLEQGFAFFSPAVRGSWGYGQEWEKMLRGDLGGNEILDLVWAARFLEKKLGLDPSRIGLEGGSHGGYATLRALTMPSGFKGVDSQYPWGFGVCWAGFADLVKFHEDSWISDWVEMLLGPLKDHRDLYVERSPLTHFEQLKAPIYIAHGTHDKRVPASTMTEFLEKLKNSDKPHLIHFIQDQGHTAGTEKDRLLGYRTQYSFLSKHVPE
ncbi:MAG: S9 family peptidase [Bdellovibrionaceae bacterium]|nr:S9 family peptidase [Pseudobdellovibrionaceae bacterium]MBX3034665.1 S9 family peptidase [Pseudobdellovibrionaceae bacterium]